MAGYYDVLHCLSVSLEKKGFREIRASIIKAYNQHIADMYAKINAEWFKENKKEFPNNE
jgi:hypothetical protein